MPRTSVFLAACAALALALAPGLADARAGYGSSMGSRGSRTWSAPPSTGTAPGAAQPFQRSMTPNAPSPGYGAPGYASPGYGSPGFAGGGRSAFTSGLLGGLLGAGIGGMLFGGGFFGGMHGGFGFLGFLLQIFLVVMIGRWLFRRFLGAGARPSFAGGVNAFGPPGNAGPGARPMPVGGASPAARGVPVTVGPQEYEEFERVLKAVQFAWSEQDLAGLRQLCTPEMVSYFAEQLADQASRGVHNTVTDIRLLQGDLSEAWAENGREYATVAMRFGMIDVTRDASGTIVDGSATEHVTATELWTYVRAPGGRWLLSAIQQVR